MQRKVWSPTQNSMVWMKYLRLGMIDEYNNFMNSVDLADQLRNCYRFNHWLRNRKWWWAIFLWAVGVGATNAYKSYEILYEEERKKGKHGLPPKWTHLQFLQELIYDFLGWDGDSTKVDSGSDSVTATTRRGSVYSSADTSQCHFYNIADRESLKEYYAHNQARRIHRRLMEEGKFSSRFDGKFHPHIPTTSANANCQSCKYFLSVQNKKNIERCVVCGVNLCWQCRLTWHGVGLDEVNKMLSK